MLPCTYLKKIITLLLFVSIVGASFLPHPIFAQVSGGGGSNAQGGFDIQGIGGVAVNCVGVGNLISEGVGAVGDFFSDSNIETGSPVADGVVAGVGGLADALETGNPGDIAAAAGDIAADVVGGGEVPVGDSEVRKTTEDIKKEEEKANWKERCLDAIARYAVLKVMDKITLMTVEWINSGFQGNPFYPENRPNFFEQIAKDEVLNFSAWFSADSGEYPFGIAIVESILLSVENRIQDNLRFSLNQVLQHNNQYANYDSFTAKFSIGGWAGYTAFIQPNNNIFGNYLMANQYLARQTAGTSYTYARNFQNELNEGRGFLNQRECRQTALNDSLSTAGDDYIDPTDPLYLGNRPLIPEGATMTQAMYESLPPAVQDYLDQQSGTDGMAAEYNFIVKRSTCVKWHTVTPGSILAETTTQVLGSPLRTLELSDELNENLGLIFDALALQLFKKIGGGIRSLYNSEEEYSSNPNDPNYNALWAQVNDPSHGSTFQQQPLNEAISGDEFNLGIVALQAQYLSVAGSNIEKLVEIIRDIRALDYCVPGPNPAWYQNGYSYLIEDILPNITPAYFENASENQQYYADTIEQLTGINISPTPAIENHQQFSQFMVFVLNKYKDAITELYPLNNAPPPSIRPTAANLFNQIATYQSQLTSYYSQVQALAMVMPQLEDIQTQVLALDQDASDYESSMATLTSLFSQVASQGVLINQAQFDQATDDEDDFDAMIGYVNGLIQLCVDETTSPSYSGGTEKVPYPFSSIFGNLLVAPLQPNTGYFLENVPFGDNANQIDLSTFNGGINIQSSTPTSTFTDLIQSVF